MIDDMEFIIICTWQGSHAIQIKGQVLELEPILPLILEGVTLVNLFNIPCILRLGKLWFMLISWTLMEDFMKCYIYAPCGLRMALDSS
jgi:hypothetical protein